MFVCLKKIDVHSPVENTFPEKLLTEQDLKCLGIDNVVPQLEDGKVEHVWL